MIALGWVRNFRNLVGWVDEFGPIAMSGSSMNRMTDVCSCHIQILDVDSLLLYRTATGHDMQIVRAVLSASQIYDHKLGQSNDSLVIVGDVHFQPKPTPPILTC
jgi:hypothetical protein